MLGDLKNCWLNSRIYIQDQEESLLESDHIEVTPHSAGHLTGHPMYTESANNPTRKKQGFRQKVSVPQGLRVLVDRMVDYQGVQVCFLLTHQIPTNQ